MAESERNTGAGGGSDRSRGPTDDELRSTVPRDRGGRELRVGAFVIVGFLSFIVVLFLLTDPATLRGRYMVVTTMDDAGGVRRGDPIQMRGVNVGRIHGFEMTPDGRVHMTMEIEGEWQFPEGSVAALGESGLFGGRTVEIVPGPGEDMIEPWDTIAGAGAGVTLFETAGELSQQAEQVMASLNRVLSGPTTGAMEESALELRGLLAELRQIAGLQRRQLADLTASLTRSAENLEEAAGAAPDVARAAARADTIMIGLNRTTATLDDAMASLDVVLERLAAGEGTLGRLSTDEALYENLNRAAESIALLATDIRENPRRYVHIEVF